MPLTTDERERVRYHLGYMSANSGASVSLGIARPVETMYLVEEAMDQLMENAVPRVRRQLTYLDNVELQLVDSQCYLAAERLEGLVLRPSIAGQTHPDLLEREYARWAKRLADMLGVPLYPSGYKFKGHSVNVGVGTG
jgi:hypothetical protein